MPRRDEESPSGLPQSWSTAGQPIAIYTGPPYEPEAAIARGATGIGVLLIVIAVLTLTVWQFYGTWTAFAQLQQQRRITEAAAEFTEYRDELESQVERMTRDRRLVLTAPKPHLLQEAVDRNREAYRARCARIARREGARCISSTSP